MPVYYPSYLSTAEELLDAYPCGLPFHTYLKSYFSKHKKFGSRDRRVVSEFCYAALRLGKSMNAYGTKEQIVVGYFLSSDIDNGCIENEIPDLLEYLSCSLAEKFKRLESIFPKFIKEDLFPLSEDLCSEIFVPSFIEFHLRKPSFFIRTIPSTHNNIVEKLTRLNVRFNVLSSQTIRIDDKINLEEHLNLDKDCFIQDLSSQRTLDLPMELGVVVNTFWDACAGSGGKLLLASTHWPRSNIFASDIRPAILDELQRRTKRFGLSNVQTFCMDLSQSLSVEAVKSFLPKGGVDLIVADVPCSGSGTWSRNPEWLSCFQLEDLKVYQDKQKRIVSNLSRVAQKGSYILYITCSVYQSENEEVVEYMQKECGLTLLKQKYLLGYDRGGDSLFTALLIL